jgi:exopolysaccharide biosynthesis polyprenyl glycosylphosphotransferase
MARLSTSKAIIKRLQDIAVACAAIIIFSPFFIIIPILIKLESPGPVFFRQKRYGLNNRMFDCLKFRSMYFEACCANEIRLTERTDPRVTRIGDFLRRTSLDEIPQFINVLKGDMSVVGPRPHPPGVKAGGRVYEDIIENFSERYAVKPGLTGWAQVNGLRGNTFAEEDLTERFKYDMDYIQNWSIWLDLVIIARTMVLGFFGKNAF